MPVIQYMRTYGGLLLLLTMVMSDVQAAEQHDPFTGSFELESGEIVTGGLTIERAGGEPVYIYMDTETLAKGGVFVREGPMTLVSVVPPGGAVSIELVEGLEGEADTILWRNGDDLTIGRRVFPHRTETVRFRSEDGTELTGRLLLPDCQGPHPLVVMIGGSGPTTRFGGPFETFFVQLGMAVLSYDKRGIEAERWSEPDLITMAQDAAAAIDLGRAHPAIDPDRVGVWASSQGGWVAPIAASRTPTDFMIVRVGPGVTEMDAWLHEVRQELRADGLGGIDLDKAIDLLRAVLELAVEGEPINSADRLVRPWLAEEWYLKAFGDGVVSELWSERWWGWVSRNMTLDTMEYLSTYDGPVLWFLAENDENVPLVSSQVGLERAFERSPGEDHDLVIVPDVDHSFLVRDESGARYTPHFWGRMKSWLEARDLSGAGCDPPTGQSSR